MSVVLLGYYCNVEWADTLGRDMQDWIIYLLFEQIVCLATLLSSSLSLTFTSSNCLRVSRKYWRLECPLQINGHCHDNHATSWNGMMLIMATVAGCQTNSPALPQGQADVKTPGFDSRVCTQIFIYPLTAAQHITHPDTTVWAMPCSSPHQAAHSHGKGLRPLLRSELCTCGLGTRSQTTCPLFHPPALPKRCVDHKAWLTVPLKE